MPKHGRLYMGIPISPYKRSKIDPVCIWGLLPLGHDNVCRPKVMLIAVWEVVSFLKMGALAESACCLLRLPDQTTKLYKRPEPPNLTSNLQPFLSTNIGSGTGDLVSSPKQT